MTAIQAVREQLNRLEIEIDALRGGFDNLSEKIVVAKAQREGLADALRRLYQAEENSKQCGSVMATDGGAKPYTFPH